MFALTLEKPFVAGPSFVCGSFRVALFKVKQIALNIAMFPLEPIPRRHGAYPRDSLADVNVDTRIGSIADNVYIGIITIIDFSSNIYVLFIC